MNFPSKLIESAVEQFATLPGIGKKTALRLVLHLLKKNEHDVQHFGNTLIKMREQIKYCQKCFNISDSDICEICINPKRDQSIVCVVQDIRDVLAIENTGQHRGVYHVLGGIISPMDGIGPGDLNIEPLVQKVAFGEIKEIVLALSTTMEGDTTNFYIYRRLQDSEINISVIARGIAFGDELEYADEITLGRSIVNRVPYESSISRK
jgi:recombination protein RecR